MADLAGYADAHDHAQELYKDKEEWSRRAALNIAASGKFSSDRTIVEYAREIWGVKPCAIDTVRRKGHTIAQARMHRR